MTALSGTECAAMTDDRELVERLNTAWLNSRDLFADRAYAAWPAIRALLAAAPPRQPTAQMLMAGLLACRNNLEQDGTPGIADCWRAMYDAALGAGDQQSAATSDEAATSSTVASTRKGGRDSAAGTGRPKGSVSGSAADPNVALVAEIDRVLNQYSDLAFSLSHPEGWLNLLKRARDALAEQDERDRKQCELLQAYAANEREQHERIAGLERELAAHKQDAQRYQWLRHKISGAEFRRIGITYAEPGGVDAAIDVARGGQHD